MIISTIKNILWIILFALLLVFIKVIENLEDTLEVFISNSYLEKTLNLGMTYNIALLCIFIIDLGFLFKNII
jgi:hypothetical protein